MYEARIRQYIDSAKKRVYLIPRDTSKVNETIASLDFEKMKWGDYPTEHLSFGKIEFILIPFKASSRNDLVLEKFDKIDLDSCPDKINFKEMQLFSVAAVAFFTQFGKIDNGSIVEISSPTYNSNEIELAFMELIRARRKDFTGRYSSYDLSQRLQSIYEWKNGLVISQITLTFLTTSFSKESMIRNVDWYLTKSYSAGECKFRNFSKFLYSGKIIENAPLRNHF